VEVTDALPAKPPASKASPAHQGRKRLRLLQGRARRASPRAHLAVRFQQTPAHEFSSVDTIAEIEESDGDIVIPPNEFQRGHVPFRRQGRPEREQGGNRRAHHAHPDRPRRRVAGAAFAASKPRDGDEPAALADFRATLDAAKAEMERFYGEKGSVSWGNQIRSYVFQPYRMVKDLRTGVETSNVQAVMDGDLDMFVNGWLRAGCPTKRMQGVKDEEE
jgi:hypothetical protein